MNDDDRIPSTDDYKQRGNPAFPSLTKNEVDWLQKLYRDYEACIRAGEDQATVIERLKVQLPDEQRRLAEVWGHAITHDYFQRDAKYRVLIDWLNSWVKKANDGALLCGRFQVQREVGRGGFGAVFKAYDKQLNRSVALKLPVVAPKDIPPHDDDSFSTTARERFGFVREARKHAGVETNGCVPIYDAIMPESLDVDSLLLYVHECPILFVMEYFESGSLQDRLSSGAPIPDETIVRWMTKIAETLASLHALKTPNFPSGIIHKDLKPANVLLDKQGEPFLTDFGLATARFDQKVAGNPFTGTRHYAAPELFDGIEANEQTDIWAWGVIFYELLTGQLPFNCQDRICNRRSPVPKLRAARPDLPEYLESVIDRCLQRDRAGRNGRFGSFADVLDALKSNRNPRVAAFSAVVLLLLLVTIAAGVWWAGFRQPRPIATDDMAKVVAKQLAELKPDLVRDQLRKTIEETYQRDLAETESLKDRQKRDGARVAAQKLRVRVLSQVDEILQSITATIKSGDASPEFLELNRILREQGVEAALAYVTSQQLRLLAQAESAAAGPERERRRPLAPLLECVWLYNTRGEFQQAQGLGEKILLANYNWPEAHRAYLSTQIVLGTRSRRDETLRTAKARIESAHKSAEYLLKLDGQNPLWLHDVCASYTRLGEVLLQSGQVTEALGQYQKGLAICQKLAAADPSDAWAQRQLTISFNHLGEASRQAGKLDEALEYYQKDLEISRKLAATVPTNVLEQHNVAVALSHLGYVIEQAGKLDEALGHYQQALVIWRDLVAADPTDAQAQNYLSFALINLGSVSEQRRKLDEAREYYQQALQINCKLTAVDPTNADARRGMAFSFSHLGDVSREASKLDETRNYYQQALEIHANLAAADPSDAEAQGRLLKPLNDLGDVSLQTGNRIAALEYFQNALEISRKLAAADPTNADAQRKLSVSFIKFGFLSEQAGRLDPAREYYQQALEIRRKLAAADPTNTDVQRDLAQSFNRLGFVSEQADNVDAAVEFYERELAIRLKVAADDPTNTEVQRDLLSALNNLGFLCRRFGGAKDPNAALEYYRKALEISSRLAAAEPTNVELRIGLYRIYDDLGDCEEREERYAKAIEWYEKVLAVLFQLDEAGNLQPGEKRWITAVEEAIAECEKEVQKGKPDR